MCDPISLASFAIGTASQVMSYQAEKEAANNQNRLYDQNHQNALRAFEENQKSLTNRQSQTLEAAATEKFDNSLETQKAAATERVAAGEAGVSGLSIDAMFRDIYSQTNRANDRIDQNTDWTMSQLQSEKRGAGYQTLDRINSVQKATKPSFANVGLRILGGGVDAYSAHLAANPTVPAAKASGRVPVPTARPLR